MASYEMQESNLPGRDGERVLFPRMKLWGQMDLDEIAERICRGSTFAPGEVKGLVQALAEEIACGMAGGRARSICVDRIHFRADKELLRQTARQCTLERSDWKFRKSSARYTPRERLGLAQEYLQSHPFLTVAAYAGLTGLLHNAASKELRRWADDETSGIVRSGRGAHKVYVRRTATSE